MAIDPRYQADVDIILSHRHDLGADLWTTPDRRLVKGSPFSAMDSALMLLDLGMPPDDPILQAVAALFWDAWQPDGRFKLYPKGAMLPCLTAPAANLLCHMGYADDPRLQTTLDHLLSIQYEDGGLRCNKFSFGRGPETEHSNPHPTLIMLDAFRQTNRQSDPALTRAVEFLLWHWTVRTPIGPCHYGIGTLFMQVAYPFRDYNLFYYVYVLSFYEAARQNPLFHQAFSALQSRTTDGEITIQRTSPKLATLPAYQKNKKSPLATKHYQTILQNLKK